MAHWNCQAMTQTAVETWCSKQLASQLQQLGGNTGPSRAGTCASEWRGFSSQRERPTHFQRQHCACETPTTLQEESTISFTFSLSVCISQSNTLSFQDKDTCFYFRHMKNKNAHKTETLFFLHLCKANTPICLTEIINSSSRFLIASVLQHTARYNLMLDQKKIIFIMPYSGQSCWLFHILWSWWTDKS